MSDILKDLYAIVEQRKNTREEGSYTAYLFDQGLDKILKKVAEETGETIIAAKCLEAAMTTGTNAEAIAELRVSFTGEIADLLYHVVVLGSALGVGTDEVELLLTERAGKTRNLKAQKQTDKNS